MGIVMALHHPEEDRKRKKKKTSHIKEMTDNEFMSKINSARNKKKKK